LNGVTKETVDKKIIRNWGKGKLNSHTMKFFNTGATNQSFGLLQGIKVTCEKKHVHRYLRSTVFLNLSDAKGYNVDEMIADEFSYKGT
jgi:hypothetical protein